MKIIHQNLPLKACSNATIARADDVFSYIDSDFTDWKTDVKSEKTAATEMAMLEMDKDGTFADIFGSISKDTESMVMTQAQIIEFMKSHKKELRTDSYSTFFLFKVKSEFFVARVFLYSGGALVACVYRFSYDFVWSAECRRRVVVPQPALGDVDLSLSPSDALTLEAAIKRVKEEGYVIYKPI